MLAPPYDGGIVLTCVLVLENFGFGIRDGDPLNDDDFFNTFLVFFLFADDDDVDETGGFFFLGVEPTPTLFDCDFGKAVLSEIKMSFKL